MVSALCVLPSAETHGDWYLSQQRQVCRSRLPGHSGSLFLLFLLYVVLDGGQYVWLVLRQQAGCFAFRFPLLLLIVVSALVVLIVLIVFFPERAVVGVGGVSV